MGNNLVYADTYQEALAQLAGEKLPSAPAIPATGQPPTTTAAPPSTQTDARVAQIRQHLARYRELVSQGKLSDAGKELEAIQALVGQ
jgi:uncharacterized membrane protein (UPF0182 family)